MSFAVATPQWDAAQTAWKNAVEKFAIAYSEFTANQQKAFAQGKIREWQSLNQRAFTVKDTVGKVAGPVNTLYGWLDKLTGGNNRLASLAEEFGLGFVPKIPLAVVNSSTGAVFLITMQLNKFNASLGE